MRRGWDNWVHSEKAKGGPYCCWQLPNGRVQLPNGKKTDLDSSQVARCQSEKDWTQVAMSDIAIRYKEKGFHCQRDQILEQGPREAVNSYSSKAQRIQNPTWHSPEQPALTGPTLNGGLDQMTSTDPVQPTGFCGSVKGDRKTETGLLCSGVKPLSGHHLLYCECLEYYKA